ncbi:hypothetical protein QAD02_011578 [Eretmocerus hayati]|uniref:Uncharacterized protein n=1 Tax=Eretmocerus hayati TaxID=131215 RepID=A0ACC2P013_9HYME|nr:hypothetical protein QAD02_011578 [Eretmocerus hayati]
MSSQEMAESGICVDKTSIIRDLQFVLCNSSGERFIVVDFSAKPLLPKGENFGSYIQKLDIIVKRCENSSPEKLYLVAKMLPLILDQKNNYNYTLSFKREIFVFERLLPTYRELEIEVGVSEKDLLDIVPKFYGGRLTRNKKWTDQADSDAIILLENLQLDGYSTGSRKRGLNLNHAKLAISKLAQYHALGIVMRHRRPSFFEEAKKYMTSLPFETSESMFNEFVRNFMCSICTDLRIAKYKDRIRATIDACNGWQGFTNFKVVEPWITIIHGDFWVNNIMFNWRPGNENEVKFIDFQISRICSPLKDVIYFTCSSTSSDVLLNHLDELLDTYYEKLIESLDRLGHDSSAFTKSSFDHELQRIASHDLFYCISALKVFTLDVPKDQREEIDISELLMSHSGNSLYLDRTWHIISKYTEKGWI